MPDSTSWSYYLPNIQYGGWAQIILTRNGMFAAVSDFGNYAYAWRSHGYDDFRQFVAGLARDPDYFVCKVAPKQEYDGEATLRAIREHILEYRADNGYTRQFAREEWDRLELYELEDASGFSEWRRATAILDAYEFACSRPDPDAVAFAGQVLPRLRDVLIWQMWGESCAP